MDTEIKTKLKNWAELHNNHPCDDERLYEIALNTIQKKIDQVDFEDVAGKELFEKYYEIYEHLLRFAKYLKDNGLCKC